MSSFASWAQACATVRQSRRNGLLTNDDEIPEVPRDALIFIDKSDSNTLMCFSILEITSILSHAMYVKK